MMKPGFDNQGDLGDGCSKQGLQHFVHLRRRRGQGAHRRLLAQRPAFRPLQGVFNLTEADEGCREITLPGSPVMVPWPIPRPDLISGSHAERSSRLADTVRMIRRRVELFAELPFDKLDRLAMQLDAEKVHRRAEG